MKTPDYESLPVDITPPDAEGRLEAPLDIIKSRVEVKDMSFGQVVYLAPGSLMRDKGRGVMFIDTKDVVPPEEPQTLRELKSRPAVMQVVSLEGDAPATGYIVDCRHISDIKIAPDVDFTEEYSAEVGFDEHQKLHGSVFPLGVMFADEDSLRYVGDDRFLADMDILMEEVDRKAAPMVGAEARNSPESIVAEIARLVQKLQSF